MEMYKECAFNRQVAEFNHSFVPAGGSSLETQVVANLWPFKEFVFNYFQTGQFHGCRQLHCKNRKEVQDGVVNFEFDNKSQSMLDRPPHMTTSKVYTALFSRG